MATHALPASRIFDEVAPQAPPHARRTSQRITLLRRLYNAILQSQMRRAQRDIDRVLGHGALRRDFDAGLPPDR